MSAESAQQTKIHITCPNVAHGNPSCAFAVRDALEARGAIVNCQLLEVASVFGKAIQKAVTSVPHVNRFYTEKGECARGGPALLVFGALALAEIYARNPSYIFAKQNQSGIGVFVQEHPLGLFNRERLERMYPNGSYLVVPDVEPKQSARTVMEKTGITPLTWARSTYEKLQQAGLSPVLVEPFLPYGFCGYEKKPIQGEYDYILVKAPGAGFSQEDLNRLHTALFHIDIPFVIFSNGSIISECGKIDVSNLSLDDRVHLFYDRLTQLPPRMLISPPSEMVQVTAGLQQNGWGGHFFTTPERGQHEVVSNTWGLENGVVAGRMEIGNAAKMCEQIWSVFHSPRHSNPAITEAIGDTPFYKAILIR